MNNSVASATESKDKTTMEKKNLKEVEPVTNCDRFKTLKHSSSAPYAFTEQRFTTSGAPVKDLGKKWFGFTLMRDITVAELLEKIKGEQ